MSRRTIGAKYSKTGRGFPHIAFTDANGRKCSAQDSSWAAGAAMWLGQDEVEPPNLGHQLSPRMHLTIPQARQLITILQRFVDTGSVAR